MAVAARENAVRAVVQAPAAWPAPNNRAEPLIHLPTGIVTNGTAEFVKSVAIFHRISMIRLILLGKLCNFKTMAADLPL